MTSQMTEKNKNDDRLIALLVLQNKWTCKYAYPIFNFSTTSMEQIV